jgi:hypothetical protein
MDITEIGEGGEETMSRSLGEFDLIGQLPDANPLGTLPEDIKDGRSPFDRLDKIIGF